MVRILHRRSAKVAVAAGSAVALFAGGMAWAGGGGTDPVKMTGGSQVQTKVVTDVDPFTINNLDNWVNVPMAKVQVTVPQGTQRLVKAHFNAETSCSAVGTIIDGWCATRVVARKISGSNTIEMHPQAGVNFAIDSGSDDAWEGHSMDRALLLGAGTWNVWVQGTIQGTDGALTIDDWYFEVEVNK